MENKEITASYAVSADYIQILATIQSDKEKMDLIPLFMSLDYEDIKEKEDFVVRLFNLSDVDQPDEIANRLFERGYRPAVFKQMLAFLIQYPEFKKIPMVAYYSGHWFNKREYFQPISYFDDKIAQWQLGYQCFICCLKENNKKCWFLGVEI